MTILKLKQAIEGLPDEALVGSVGEHSELKELHIVEFNPGHVWSNDMPFLHLECASKPNRVKEGGK